MAKQVGINLTNILTIASAGMIIHILHMHIILVLIPVFMHEFNISLLEAGLIASTPLLFGVFLALPTGWISDKLGARSVMATSLGSLAAAALVGSQAFNVYVLIVSFLILASTDILYDVSASTLISQAFPSQHRAKAFGMHDAGVSFGMAIGPITISLFLATLGWRWAFIFWAIPTVVLIPLVLRVKLVPEEAPKEKAEGRMDAPQNSMRSIATAGFLLFIVALGFNAIGGETIDSFMTSYLAFGRLLPVAESTFLFGLMPLMGLIGGPS